MNPTLNENGCQTKSTLWTINYIILMVAGTFSTFSFFLIYTIFSKYLVGIGTTLTLTGIVIGILSISSLVIRPFSGAAADRYNKKNILIFATFITGFCFFGYVLTNSVAIILMFRILYGLAAGITGTTLVSLVSDYIPKERMGEGIGYFGLGQAIASSVAPGLGIIAANRLSIPVTFIIAGIIAVTGALLLIPLTAPLLSKDTKKIKKGINLKSLFAKEAVFYSILSGLLSISGTIVSTYLLLVAMQRHINDISVYFFVSAVFMFLARPITGKILDRKGLAFLFYPSFAIIIVSMVLHGVSNTLWLFLLVGALRSFATGFISPALQAECLRKVSKDRSGVVTSTYYMGLDIAQGIGPVVGGIIAVIFNYAATFYFCAFLLFVGGVLFYLFDRKGKKLNFSKLDKLP